MYICSLIASRICTATRIMTGFVPSGRESSWQRMYFRCRFVPAVRRISSHAAIRPEANLIPSKRKTAVVSYKRRGLGISVPEQARMGKKKKKKEKEKRRGRGTRREEHGGPILGGREFCTASAYRNLRREHRSGRRPQDTSLSPAPLAPARSPRRRATIAPVSLPISLSLSLSFSLFSRFASSHSSPFRALRTLCSSLVSRFLFFSRKWTKLRRPRVSCALRLCSYSCWESLMLDDDIWRYSRNIWSYPKILKILNCFDILCVHCFNICQVKILSCNFLIYNIVTHLSVHN